MKLSAWLLHQLTEENPAGRCSRIAAYLVTANGSIGTEVVGFTVPENADGAWCAQRTEDFEEHTQADADSMGGAQVYHVVCYFADRPSIPGARMALKAFGSNTDEGLTEPATAVGLTHQLMRHLEAKERIVGQTMAHVVSVLERQNQTLSEENEQHRMERIKLWEMTETLLTHRDERALENKKAEAKIEVFQKSALALREILPKAINTAFGKNILPETSATSEMASLIRSLNPQQLEQITDSLDPTQLDAFLKMVRPMMTEEDVNQDPSKH